tara:strand:+ start:1876 stop:2517 length:642 start_codon:yes stop_codon:yes gene_type:complete
MNVERFFYSIVIYSSLLLIPLFSLDASAAVNINKLSASKIKTLDKIEQYLNNIRNLKADFTQTHQGVKSYGKFYLSRPGKMRIEYNSSQNILITVNGSILTYKDLELDEISNLSTNTTPASFLTRKNISFKAKDILIDSLQINKNETSVTVIKKNRPEAGKFKITFDPQITSFKRLEVINEGNESVLVYLSNISYPQSLRSNLFYIKNNNLPL